MSVKDLLQGKWLGHPLHPALVHVPAGLWPAALIFDLLGWFGGASDVAARVAFWAIAVGLLVAILAAATGLADWWDIKKEKPAHRIGLWHMVLNVTVVALMAGSLVWRWRAHDVTVGAIALCALANVVLAISGYLGGRMVYDQGVSVARMSKKYWRKVAEAGKAYLPAE